MMGSTIFRVLAASPGIEVHGTVRSNEAAKRLPTTLADLIVGEVEAASAASIDRTLASLRPDVVINGVGIVKQLPGGSDPLIAIPVNALLPHRLAQQCQAVGARLIHLSSDCVFDGSGSMYREADFASANDLYGRTKYLGEVDYPNAITLRTSTIGRELGSHHGLLEWFLSQQVSVRGYRRALYSGLTTPELARVIRDCVIPHPEMHGLFHVSGDVINKYELLRLIRDAYGKQIEIEPYDGVAIDRSLDSSRFRDITGYRPPPWPTQIAEMYRFG
jgi:dTDP-4-dehydrorhamnose reductase